MISGGTDIVVTNSKVPGPDTLKTNSTICDDAKHGKFDLDSPSVVVSKSNAFTENRSATGDVTRDTSVVCCRKVIGTGSSLGGHDIGESECVGVSCAHEDLSVSSWYSDEAVLCLRATRKYVDRAGASFVCGDAYVRSYVR